jgi:hypothetical protein
VIGTLLLLTAQSFKNRTWQSIKRLRNPRYLVGGIAGAMYFWFMIFRNTHRPRPVHLKALPLGDVGVLCVSGIVLIMMIAAWALPGDSGGLEFSEAEIAFLFPAPLRRWQLLLYKVIRSQPQALLSAFFFTIFAPVHGKFVGVWLAVSVISIYFMLVALGRARLKLMHIGFLVRLVIVGVAFAALSAYATHLAREVNAHLGKSYADTSLGAGFAQLMHRQSVRVILFIPRWFAGAVVPTSITMLVLSCAVLILLGIGFFIIAAAINVSFQEASISYSQRRAQRRERIRDNRIGGRVVFRRAPAPFRLGETGPPEIAFIWKNVIAMLRTNIVWAVLLSVMIAFIMGEAVWTREAVGYQVCGSLLLMLAALFPFLGVQLFANDLRLDLRRAEVLKSYPISGDRLVAAEVAAPLAIITIFELLLVGCGTTLVRLGGGGSALGEFVSSAQFVVVALLLTLPICALQLLLRNAAPIYFPAWVLRSKDDQRGFVAAGQRLIVLFGNILCLSILLIPPALVFVPSAWIAWRYFSGNPAGLAVATMPAIAVIAGEAWMGLKILGAQFERLDVSSEFDIATT